MDDNITKRRCVDCGKTFQDYRGNKLPCPDCYVKNHLPEMESDARDMGLTGWTRRMADEIALIEEIKHLRAKLVVRRRRTRKTA